MPISISMPDLVTAALTQADTTTHVSIEPGGMSRVAPYVAEAFADRPVVIVADETTWRIAGEPMAAMLEAQGHPMAAPIVFPAAPTLRPDTNHVGRIKSLLAAIGEPVVPIAAGSGAINDLTKRAAFELGLPYISVATAASMDGYTASGAALIDQGVKQTFACDAPVAVFADLDVVASAPPAMTAAGYGDLLGKVTAGADWIVADALGVEPIQQQVWEMVQGPLPGMLADPARYAAGDPAAIRDLFLGLVLTGLAIQVSGSSRCASGSEHQFSHLWEMRGLEHRGELVSHGAKVGFGSLVSSAMYEQVLARDWSALDVEQAVAAWPSWEALSREIAAMEDSPTLIERALEECQAKYVPADDLRDRLERLRKIWPDLAERLRQQLPGAESLRELLIAVGAPSSASDLGLTWDQVRASYSSARRIRKRYTIFDLAFETSTEASLVTAIFEPGGFWAPNQR